MKDRIDALIKQEKLSYGQFAEKLGIDKKNSSIISHIISGRNNPSLEFVQKILTAFPEINPDWLIFAKEPMLRQKTQARPTSLFDLENENIDTEQVSEEPKAPKNMPENPNKKIKTDENAPKADIPPPAAPPESKIVKKIVVFYSDATYEEFNK